MGVTSGQRGPAPAPHTPTANDLFAAADTGHTGALSFADFYRFLRSEPQYLRDWQSRCPGMAVDAVNGDNRVGEFDEGVPIRLYTGGAHGEVNGELLCPRGDHPCHALT